MYTDLLIQIKNAQSAGKESIKVPFSTMDVGVLDILERYRFIKSFEKKGRSPKKYFDIVLRYVGHERVGAISGVSFISKPSRRIYKGYRDIKSVRQGYGIGVMTTPKGIMTTLDATKEKIGGQLLFTIW